MRRFPGGRLILGLVALAAAFGLYRRNRRGGGNASADAARLQRSPGAWPIPAPDLLCRLFPGRFCGHRVVAVGSVLKVRPTDQPAGAARAQLLAARNEFESFQIVVQAGRTALRGVNVSLTAPLSGAGGTIPPQNVTIYREAYYAVAVPSNSVPPADPRAAAGPWPDALIPAVDPWFGQPRNAFPVDVPAGENRVAWVDVFVPPATPPGRYAGTITVTAARFSATVSVELTVFGATLPSTASLHSAFAIGWDDVCRARYGGRGCFVAATEAEGWRLNALCARVALDNRVTISYPHYQPLQVGNVALFRQHVLPLLNGTAATRLPGARLTAFQVDAGPSLPAWRVEAQQQGFADRAFVYACDEPGDNPAAWAGCQQAANEARQVWPDVPVLVTASLQNATQAGATTYVNRLVVLANEMHDKPGQPNAGDRRADYDSFVTADARNQVWLYSSCMSHGCEPNAAVREACQATPPGPGTSDAYFTGWPDYVIDTAASQARAMGWMAFLYRATGELYFQTTHCLPTAWTAQYAFGGNGDGTLFYPGDPQAIGGTDWIPLESIRLKLIRDGREDYEYLKLLADRNQGAAARAVAQGLFPTMYEAIRSDADVQAARRALARLIDPANVP